MTLQPFQVHNNMYILYIYIVYIYIHRKCFTCLNVDERFKCDFTTKIQTSGSL